MIHVHVIAHDQQRYPTCGDWQVDQFGEWHIHVSDLKDWRYHFLVALHEQIEMAICQATNVSQATVDAFDQGFEASRSIATHDQEPGAQPEAPYHAAHMFAEAIERQVAKELGVDWDTYDHAVMSLP